MKHVTVRRNPPVGKAMLCLTVMLILLVGWMWLK